MHERFIAGHTLRKGDSKKKQHPRVLLYGAAIA